MSLLYLSCLTLFRSCVCLLTSLFIIRNEILFIFLGLLVRDLRSLLGVFNVDSFPSIYNDIVDGIPENYVHYYEKYLYEIEIIRCKENFPSPLRSCDIPVAEKEKQLVINFKFDEK